MTRTRPLRRAPRLDAYAAAMVQAQIDLFMTEQNGMVLAPSLPAAYRRTLLPSPAGQAREGVAYFELQPQQDAPPQQPPRRRGVWVRLGERLRAALARALGYRRLPTSPLETP